MLLLAICRLNAALSIQTNSFLYSAQYTDAESALQYLNARYYDPSLQRFVAWDSYDLLNRYAYADGNPVLNDDPSGHIAKQVDDALNYTFGGLTVLGTIGSAAASISLACTLPEATPVEDASLMQKFLHNNGPRHMNLVAAVSGSVSGAASIYAQATGNDTAGKIALGTGIAQTGLDTAADLISWKALSQTADSNPGLLNLNYVKAATLTNALSFATLTTSIFWANQNFGYAALGIQSLAAWSQFLMLRNLRLKIIRAEEPLQVDPYSSPVPPNRRMRTPATGDSRGYHEVSPTSETELTPPSDYLRASSRAKPRTRFTFNQSNNAPLMEEKED